MRLPSNGRLFIAAALAGVLGAAAATGAAWLLHASEHRAPDLHAYLHQQIPLSASEQQRLEMREQTFIARRAAIEARMKAANGRLARAIGADPGWSPEVEAASREVEASAAELERATLQHVIEMRDGLEPQHRAAYQAALVKALADGAK